jgi:uncharacterized membrane protein YoaK (UPF0700 family)
MNTVGTAYGALVKHDHNAMIHTRRGVLVIVSYAVGAVLGALGVREFGRHGLLCAAVILGGALLLFVIDERHHVQSQPE